MDMEKIKDRIRKLLRLADDSSSPNEAAIAANRAAKLMQQHQLAHADVLTEELDGGTADMDSVFASRGYGRVPGWLQSLSVSIAKASDCEVRITWDDARQKRIEFCGYQPDVELAEWLMTYLVTQIESMAKQHRLAVMNSDPEYIIQPRRYMNSYRDGMGAEIRNKLAEFYKQGQQEVSNTSRALVSAKKNAIEREFGRFRYGRRTRSHSAGGYQNGRTDGANVNVSRGMTSGRSSRKAGPALLN